MLQQSLLLTHRKYTLAGLWEKEVSFIQSHFCMSPVCQAQYWHYLILMTAQQCNMTKWGNCGPEKLGNMLKAYSCSVTELGCECSLYSTKVCIFHWAIFLPIITQVQVAGHKALFNCREKPQGADLLRSWRRSFLGGALFCLSPSLLFFLPSCFLLFIYSLIHSTLGTMVDSWETSWTGLGNSFSEACPEKEDQKRCSMRNEGKN